MLGSSVAPKPLFAENHFGGTRTGCWNLGPHPNLRSRLPDSFCGRPLSPLCLLKSSLPAWLCCLSCQSISEQTLPPVSCLLLSLDQTLHPTEASPHWRKGNEILGALCTLVSTWAAETPFINAPYVRLYVSSVGSHSGLAPERLGPSREPDSCLLRWVKA